MDFDTIQEQTTYFLNKSKLEFEDLTYQRVNNNSINLEVAYEDLYDINYMMFQNDRIPGKWFYAFITSYDFVSPNVTRISYQIDCYQTWLFDMTWQSTYVEREHTKRFNSDGTPVINTLDEGLAYGDDYKTVYKRKCNNDNIIWLVAITKLPMHMILSGGGTAAPSNIGGVRNPLFFTLLPLDLDNENVTINGNRPDYTNILLLGQDEQTVGQLVSLYYTPYVPFEYSLSNNNDLTVSDPNIHIYTEDGYSYMEYNELMYNRWTPKNYTVSNNMYSDIMPNYSESKLLMYPYTIIELTDMKGNTVTLKPQNFDSNSLVFQTRGSISTQPKTAIYPVNYLGNTSGGVVDFTGGIIDNTICDVPIVDDYTASYMQANRNSIATTNKYALDNANRGIIQNNAVNNLQNVMMDKQQQYMESDTGWGFAKNLFNMKIGSAIETGYNLKKEYDLSQGQRLAMNQNNDIANHNLRVNAMQAIGMTQAKINDINNIPPTVSNLGNNTMFDTGWKNMHYYVMIKTVREEYAEQLTNYFKMFGYKVNKLEVPNTKSRQYYNYIKTVDANIIGNIPSNDLNTIKGIFDKGVTIWHTDNVGDYTVNNVEVN
jgi:hypothetical protein